MKKLNIACLGEAMIEMVPAPDATCAQLGVAGDAMNTAIYLARQIQSGHRVSFVSMIGRDRLSDRIAGFIADEGVSTDLLTRHPSKLPGIYSITTNQSGERSFSYWRGQSAARQLFVSPQSPQFEQLEKFDVLFMSAISLAILQDKVREQLFEWVASFRKSGGLFVFDSNYRPALWQGRDEARSAVASAWSCCDIALPSIDDELALFDDADAAAVISRLLASGVKTGALKRGQLGPLPIGPAGGDIPDFKPAEKVVDTTAAGDSFNGAFLASCLTSGNLIEAMKSGHELASRVVGVSGAIIPRNSS
jgi:2-dehydro-3-deoxygluconokinase